MHITMRRVANLPSFRQQRVRRLVLQQMRRLNDEIFQLVHFSIQSNHLHLIVEARDREAIIRKIQGFMVAFAKRLNTMLGGRRGKVWSDRYFRRDVMTSREMHALLRYVFHNAKKHGALASGVTLDAFSSAWTFDGWDAEVPRPDDEVEWPRPTPRTRLLKIGWFQQGPLSVAGERATGPRFD